MTGPGVLLSASSTTGVTRPPAAVARTRRRRLAADDRPLVVLFVVQVGFQAAFGAFITTYAPFASDRLGWSTAEIGIVYALFALGTVLVGPWFGRLADRRGGHRSEDARRWPHQQYPEPVRAQGKGERDEERAEKTMEPL